MVILIRDNQTGAFRNTSPFSGPLYHVAPDDDGRMSGLARKAPSSAWRHLLGVQLEDDDDDGKAQHKSQKC